MLRTKTLGNPLLDPNRRRNFGSAGRASRRYHLLCTCGRLILSGTATNFGDLVAVLIARDRDSVRRAVISGNARLIALLERSAKGRREGPSDHWALLHSVQRSSLYYDLRSSGTLPPFSASFCMTCLCSQIFIDAESFMSPP